MIFLPYNYPQIIPAQPYKHFRGKTYSWQIPQDLTNSLEIFSQKAGVTLFYDFADGI